MPLVRVAVPSKKAFELSTDKPVKDELANDAVPSVTETICAEVALRRAKALNVPSARDAEPSVRVLLLNKNKLVSEPLANDAMPSVTLDT